MAPRTAPLFTDICVAGTCCNPRIARGWCAMHYQRWKKYGDPETVLQIQGDDQTRFWSKVCKTANCWLWTDALDKDGYGKFRLGSASKRAHRIAWEFDHGEVPDGLTLDHLCRVRSCVNPMHLEPVTTKVNTRRGNAVSEHTCRRGHERTAQNTGFYPKDQERYCKDCKREDRMRLKVMS